MLLTMQKLFARAFAYLFYIFSGVIVISSIYSAIISYHTHPEFIDAIIKLINSNIIALAVFELAMVIHKEYGNEDQHDVIMLLRRTLPRFIGTVCVALALEGLIMVIKYSQMDMAGNLIYPVGIIASAGVLLLSLSFFLKYVPKPKEE
ncbi:hypothetical protein M1D72_20895 [Vibrio sp. AK197]|uniref:GNAT family acetyltransferase n=1 Tax=Vibrio olivae TaxID=1243002 RepID=A0ABV5HR87_9VIBR